MNKYTLGIDVGTINDFTSEAVVQRYGAVELVTVNRVTHILRDHAWQFGKRIARRAAGKATGRLLASFSGEPASQGKRKGRQPKPTPG